MNGHSRPNVGVARSAHQFIAPSNSPTNPPDMVAQSITPTAAVPEPTAPRHTTINLNTYLEIQGLKKSFGLKPVLRGVNLTLGRGERMALLGANGGGKTTLLRILAGLTKPSAGTATIAELDIVRHTQHIRHLVGFLSHQPYLYDELTALENLLFFAKMYTVKHAHERAGQLLHRVGLTRQAKERVGTLSRGQVQRL